MQRKRGLTRFARVGTALVSLSLITIGAGALTNGALNYRNWWGGPVFAPISILVGIVVLFIALFRPATLEDTQKKRSRIRDWPH